MPLFWVKSHIDESEVTVGPVVTSDAAVNSLEGTELSYAVTADQTLATIRFTGGTDQAHFQRDGLTISWIDGKVTNFEAPDDSDTNGTYQLKFIPTNIFGVDGAEFTLTVTLTNDTSEVTVDPATFTYVVHSENEVRLLPVAAGATVFDVEFNGDGSWTQLAADGLISSWPAGTTRGTKVRGRAGSVIGTASASQDITSLTAPASYNQQTVIFNGTDTYLIRGANLTGVADGKAGTVSLWFNPLGGDDTSRRIFTTSGHRFTLRLTTGNKLQFKCISATGDTVIEKVTTDTYLANSGPHHVLISWNAFTSTATMLVNGQSPTLSIDTVAILDIDYTNTNFSVGGNTSGADLWNGSLADVFFHTTAIDLTSLTNVRKFRSPSGGPRDFGETGSTPLGVQPLLWLSGVAANWHTNDGSGGGFTLNGALTEPGTSITPFSADEIVEYVGVVIHASWQSDPIWDSNNWEAKLGTCHVRYARTSVSNSEARGHMTRLYDTYGIRSNAEMAAPTNADGSFDLPQADQDFQNLIDDFGLTKVVTIEGPNEYTNKYLFEHIYTVNTSTNVITLTNTGFPSRNQGTTPTTYTSSVAGWAKLCWGDGTKAQVRAGTMQKGGSLNTGTPPGGLTKDTVYYIRDFSIVGDTVSFKLAATSGGAAIDITSTGTVAANEHHLISRWAPLLRDYQAYMYNVLHTNASYVAANIKAIGPSTWQRCVIDNEAVGELDVDYPTLHYYNSSRKPTIYSRIGSDGPETNIAQAFFDVQAMGPGLPVAVTEFGWHMGGTTAGNAACTLQVGAQYILRSICEQYWLKINSGNLAYKGYFYGLLDNDQPGPDFGMVDEAAGVYTERLPWYSLRNFLSQNKEATWNGTVWDYPTPTLTPLGIDIDTGSHPDIRHLLSRKESGQYHLLIWADFQSWKRNSGGYETGAFTAAADDNVTVKPELYAYVSNGDACTVTSSVSASSNSAGTLPGGLSAGTRYFIRKGATNIVTLYDTSAHAITGGATGLINITDAGTGVHTMTPRKAVTVDVAASPVFASATVYEPTVLRGETANTKRDTAVDTILTPNAPFTLYVPDQVQVVVFAA